MGSLIQNTVFGKKKYKPNTFIGGVAATLNTAALVATKLGIPVTRIKSFGIIENDIQFAVIGGNYTIPNSCFVNNTLITYYKDKEGLCTLINASAFYGCTSFSELEFPGVISILGNSYAGAFRNTRLTNVVFPELVTLGGSAFTQAKIVNLTCPKLKKIELNAFYYSFGIATLNFPMLETLGSSPSVSDSIFAGINASSVINVPLSFLTNNNGVSDASLQEADTYSTINYYGLVDDGTYNTIIGGVSSSLNSRFDVGQKIGCGNSRLINLQIVGNDIRFKVLGNYQIPASAFSANKQITTYQDLDSLCTKFNYRAFRTASNLNLIVADGLLEFVDECFLDTKLVNISFNSLTTISGGYGAFASLNSTLKSVSFPNLTTVSIQYRLFGSTTNLNYINIPKLSVLMPNAGTGQYLIANAKNGVVINASNLAKTSNSGAIDPSLQYAISTFNAQVNYI